MLCNNRVKIGCVDDEKTITSYCSRNMKSQQRHIRFEEDPVTEVKSFARVPADETFNLFYNDDDILRFRQEARQERKLMKTFYLEINSCFRTSKQPKYKSLSQDFGADELIWSFRQALLFILCFMIFSLFMVSTLYIFAFELYPRMRESFS